MLLLLVRHADAGNRDPDQWPDDRERPLTAKGRKVQRRVSKALGNFGLAPTHVLTSPWLRAAQTADVLTETLNLPHRPIPSEALAGPPELSRVADDIGEPGSDSIVALVGHSPWIEELAALLLTGEPAGLRMDYPKSGVMGIDLERPAAGAGELRFFVRSKMV
jgi:phosphohistidine phosphatase